MSAHVPNPTTQAQRKGLAALTASGAGILLALMATSAPATASQKPEPNGPAETSTTATSPGPPNYTNYDAQHHGNMTTTVSPSAEHRSGLDTTSVALGALGGIALGGAGLGITLGVQRRRDRSAPHPALIQTPRSPEREKET
ncbi:hypothetical protein OG558_34115 [Kribbella sp. NBC_01510]|uniref:hypothetical protein n=1 Tax=Kribbella sp. NBC_01510 TaxID=2903581 RepID=UPI00386EA5A2